MAANRFFGKISGIDVGAVFDDRASLAAAGVHKPLVAGISGAAGEGADSLVMSGGYEDDEDYGDVIIYTGHGGNDPSTKRQVADQKWTVGNQALRHNQSEGLPVRVCRGYKLDSAYAPSSGYRFDGLYYVEQSWQEVGKSGFTVCRFRLVRDDSQSIDWSKADSGVKPLPKPLKRTESTIQRLVRSNAVTRQVKAIHDFTCQICGIRLSGPGGPYAEGAHIHPLGSPHDGPDIAENVLCLCPNCHVLIDIGALLVCDDLSIVDNFDAGREEGRLRTVKGHQVGRDYLAYHYRLHAD